MNDDTRTDMDTTASQGLLDSMGGAAVGGEAGGLLPLVGGASRQGEREGAGRCSEEGAALDISFVIPGEPRGKGRHRSAALMRGGKAVMGPGGRPIIKTHADEKTVEYENLIRLAAQKAMGGRAPTALPVLVEISATCAIPKSWSLKKQRAALLGEVLPTGKPDLDNCLKAVLDGMNAIVFADDAQACRVGMTKQYGEKPGVFVRVVELHARAAR